MGEGCKQSQVALTTKLKMIYSTLFSMFGYEQLTMDLFS